MAKTKEIARKNHGGKALRKQIAHKNVKKPSAAHNTGGIKKAQRFRPRTAALRYIRPFFNDRQRLFFRKLFI